MSNEVKGRIYAKNFEGNSSQIASNINEELEARPAYNIHSITRISDGEIVVIFCK